MGMHCSSAYYDDFGRCCKVTDPLGQPTAFNYFQQPDLPCFVLAADKTHWSYDYDQRGLITMQIGPPSQAEKLIYSDEGLLLRHIDARQGMRSMQWDERGLLLASTDCSDCSTRYDYDLDGGLVAVTAALGYCTRLARDALRRITWLTIKSLAMIARQTRSARGRRRDRYCWVNVSTSN